jgi:hypothetical protein
VSTLFLDTSGWLAAMSAREAAHGEAAHAAARAAYSEEVLGGGQPTSVRSDRFLALPRRIELPPGSGRGRIDRPS